MPRGMRSQSDMEILNGRAATRLKFTSISKKEFKRTPFFLTPTEPIAEPLVKRSADEGCTAWVAFA